MANFNVNQVRHLYVAKTSPQAITESTVLSTLDSIGEFGYSSLDTDGNFFFASRGATGDLVRSDLINAKAVRHITYVSKTDDVYSLKRTKVSLDSNVNSGNPVAGQDYILVVNFKGILGFGEEDVYMKVAMSHATTGKTKAQLTGELAVNLYQNLSADAIKYANVYCGTTLMTDSVVAAHVAGTTPVTGNYLVIEEVEQPWVRGTKPVSVVPFEVFGKTIVFNSDVTPWAKVESDTPSSTLTNTKRIADLEYFCMGERGDWYRNNGWPHVVPTTYLIPADGTDSSGYNVLTLHYQYIGNGNEYAPNLSTKAIQIVSTADLEPLKNILEGYVKEAYAGPESNGGSSSE